MANDVDMGKKVTATGRLAVIPEWLKKLAAEMDVIDDQLTHHDYRTGSLFAVILLTVFTIGSHFI